MRDGKKHSEIFFKEVDCVECSGLKKKKPSKSVQSVRISDPLSHFPFLSSPDLCLIEVDNGQERHGEK